MEGSAAPVKSSAIFARAVVACCLILLGLLVFIETSNITSMQPVAFMVNVASSKVRGWRALRLPDAKATAPPGTRPLRPAGGGTAAPAEPLRGTILLWTFSYLSQGLGLNEPGDKAHFDCGRYQCDVTRDKNLLNRSNVLIFNPRAIRGAYTHLLAFLHLHVNRDSNLSRKQLHEKPTFSEG